MDLKAKAALEDARRYGIDLDMIDSNLALTVKERWQVHEEAVALALKLETAGQKRYAELQSTSRASS